MNQPAKYAQQLKREVDFATGAAKRFREQLKDAPEHSKPGLALVREYWERLSMKIAGEQKRQRAKRRMDGYGLPMLALEADSLAVITLHSIIWAHGSDLGEDDESAAIEEDEFEPEDEDPEVEEKRSKTKARKLTGLTRQIAKRCEHAWDVLPDEARDLGLDRCIKKNLKQKARDRTRARTMLDGKWSDENSGVRLGERLLALAAKTGIVTRKRSTSPGDKQAYVVSVTKAFGGNFEKWTRHSKDLLEPLFRPMVCPPGPWGPKLNDGGYLMNTRQFNRGGRKTHLVKHRGDPEMIAHLESGDFKKVLTAINAMQATRWRINREIFVTMSSVIEKLDALSPEERQRVAPAIRQPNWTWTNVLRDKCEICEDLLDEEAIYFPYQLDYRGRAYCVPASVHPQADDIGRSLLMFADSKPLGEKGTDWLAIHLANTRGKDVAGENVTRLDKASFEDRVKWARENSENIRNSARDPFEHRWWMQASKPWRFLAACFEWDAYHSDVKNFRSRLPIAMDGTCNGLQHLSALRLDQKGADETNLAPGQVPRDIYQTIADDVLSEIVKDESVGTEEADAWGLVLVAGGMVRKGEIVHSDGKAEEREFWRFDREVAKSAVMTTPYGVKRGGINLQLFTQEFTAQLHMRGSAPLIASHIKKTGCFIGKLRKSSDLLSQYIWSGFTTAERASLTRGDTTEQERRTVLASALDRIIQSPLIYDAQRFFKVKLSTEAKELLEVFAAGNLHASFANSTIFYESAREQGAMKLSRLNRILLEDAYPDGIKRPQSDRWKACAFFSEKLEDCIGKIVDPDKKMKTWFQDGVAGTIAKAKSGIRWTTPSGFLVFQETWKLESDTIPAGDIKLVVWRKPKENAVRNVKAQKRKIVANVIHSLDAAHMILTICRLHSEGLKHFGVVHDCYAVHACDVDALHRALREEFVGMYRIPEGGKSVLEKFHAEQEVVAKKLEIELPAPPPPGDFDIEQVLESEYFFC